MPAPPTSPRSTSGTARSTAARSVGSWTPGGLYTVAASYGLDYQDGSIRNRVVLDGEPIRFDDQILRHVFRVSLTVAPRYSRSILPPDEAARAKGVSR